MDSFSVIDADGQADDDVAKKARALKTRADVVAQWVGALKAAGTDDIKFRAAIDSLKADGSVTLPELIEIAWTYGRGGTKPTSKASAWEKLDRRFAELRHKDRSADNARKSRLW